MGSRAKGLCPHAGRGKQEQYLSASCLHWLEFLASMLLEGESAIAQEFSRIKEKHKHSVTKHKKPKHNKNLDYSFFIPLTPDLYYCSGNSFSQTSNFLVYHQSENFIMCTLLPFPSLQPSILMQLWFILYSAFSVHLSSSPHASIH